MSVPACIHGNVAWFCPDKLCKASYYGGNEREKPTADEIARLIAASRPQIRAA
jgi:hypothetical protein